MKDDFGALQQDSEVLRGDVSKLQQEVSSISSKQSEMCTQIGGVEQAVLQLGKQLSAMSSVLQSLVPKTAEQRQPAADSGTSQQVKSPTLDIKKKITTLRVYIVYQQRKKNIRSIVLRTGTINHEAACDPGNKLPTKLSFGA